MYWTTPSGTRYQTGSPACTRSRQSVELIAMAGTSIRSTRSAGRPGLRQLVAGAGDADELREPEQLVGVLPRQDLGQRVGAGDEEQLGVGALGVQVAQGVDGVGRALAVDVDARDGEARVGCRRDDGHQVAVLGGRDVTPLLLPGLPGRARRRPRRGRGGTGPRRRRRGDRGGWGRRSHPSPRAACVRCSGVAVRGVLGPVRLVVGRPVRRRSAGCGGLAGGPRSRSGRRVLLGGAAEGPGDPEEERERRPGRWTPNSHGGIGSSRAVGSSSLRKRATVIDMRASLAPRLSTEVVHRPVHGGACHA